MMTASVLVVLKKTNIKYCHLVAISDNQPLKFIFYITSPTALKRNRSIPATKCKFQKLSNMLETFSHTSIIVKVCTLHASCPTFTWHFIYMIPYIHNQYLKVKVNTLLLQAICIYPNLKLFRI
jgi:hypothetical protein